MRTGARLSGLALGAGAAIVMLVCTGIPLAGQGPQAYKAPRLRGTEQPDLNGVYQAFTTANWDIQTHAAEAGPVPSLAAWFAKPAGMGIVEGNEIPYQPWALAKKQENFTNRETADPEAKCQLLGVPRMMYTPYPFQIVQSPAYVAIFHEYVHTTRSIFMNSEHPPGPIEWFTGDSRGRWEGDTLVVDVKHFTDRTWLDRAGNFHSEELHLVERYTLITPDHIQYDVTLEDPKVFTRPWKISLILYRRKEKNVRVLEYECYAYAHEEQVRRGELGPK